MQNLLIDVDRLAIIKTKLKKILEMKSGHLSEALARSLGATSHAALLADLKCNSLPTAKPFDGALFRLRLEELGHSVSPVLSEMALTHTVVPYLENQSSAFDPHDMISFRQAVSSSKRRLVSRHPYLEQFLEYDDAPDLRVKSIKIDRDLWRWHPVFLRSLNSSELDFCLATVAIHRALEHGSRRCERSSDAWDVACEMVVNSILIRLKIGEPIKGIHFDQRVDDTLSAESAYEEMAKHSFFGPHYNGKSWLKIGAWRAKTSSLPIAPANLITERRPKNLYLDAIMTMEEAGGFDQFFAPPSTTVFRRPSELPSELLKCIAGIRLALENGSHLRLLDDVFSAAAAVTFAVSEISGTSNAILNDLPRLIADFPDLAMVQVKGSSIRSAIEDHLRDCAIMSLVDDILVATSSDWDKSVSNAHSLINDTKMLVDKSFTERPFHTKPLIPNNQRKLSYHGASKLLNRVQDSCVLLGLVAISEAPEIRPYQEQASDYSGRLKRVCAALEPLVHFLNLIEVRHPSRGDPFNLC